jgi:hypothetical protein
LYRWEYTPASRLFQIRTLGQKVLEFGATSGFFTLFNFHTEIGGGLFNFSDFGFEFFPVFRIGGNDIPNLHGKVFPQELTDSPPGGCSVSGRYRNPDRTS